MAKKIINVGATANDKKGDSLRAAFQKVNENFTELYAGGIGAAIDLSAVDQHVIPATDSTYDLGSPTRQWRSLYVSTDTIYIDNTPITISNNTLVVGDVDNRVTLATLDDVQSITKGDKGDTGDQGPAGPSGADGAPGEPGSGSTVTVSEIDGSDNITNQVTGVSAIRFDKDTGFNVEDLGEGEVKISLGSSWKTWQVDGQDSLVAVGEDTVTFVAGTNMSITTSAEDKTITFDATGGGDATVVRQDTAPTAANGTLWFNTVEARIYIRYNDQWVDAAPTVLAPPETDIDVNSITFADASVLTSAADLTSNRLVNGLNELVLGTDGSLTVNGDPVVINLSQISEDILPAFSEVYDIGSTSKRFYDAFIANNIDINGAQLTGSVSGLATTGNITADGLISDSVVTTSMLAGDVLISDNIITPDNAVPSEYSGSNLGELVVNGNLTVSGDWLNVPVVETVTETTQTEVVTENTLYTTIDIRPYPMGLAYVLSLTRTGPSTAIIDIDLGSNTYSNYLDITDKLIPWLQSRPTNIQFRVDTNGFGELESIIVIAVVAVTVLQSNYSSSLTRFRIECEAINTTTGVANLSLLKFADVPYTETTTEIVTETTVVSEPSTTGVEGFIRFNKDVGSFEGHNGTEWDALGGTVDLTGYATESYVGTAVNNVIDAAPGALNTLNELAAALNDDANFASTVITSLSNKQATLVSGTNIKTVNGASLVGSGDIVGNVRTAISYTDGSTTLTAIIDYPNDIRLLAVKDGAGFQYLSGGNNNTGWPDLDVYAEFWNQPIGTVFTLTSLRDVYNNTTPGSFTFTTTTAPNGELYYGVFSAGLPIGYYNPASVTYGGSPSPFGYNSATGVLEYDTEFYSSNPLTASELTFSDSTVQTTAYTGPELTANVDGSKSLTFVYINSLVIDGYNESYYSGSDTMQLGGNGFSYGELPLYTADLIRTIQPGNLVRFTGNQTPSQTYERTVVNIEEFTSGTQQFLITFSGGTLLHTPTGFTEGSITLLEFGTSEYNFSADGILTLPTDGAVSYTPSTAGDWNGTPPTTIGEAIDRLAALVKTLNSGTGA